MRWTNSGRFSCRHDVLELPCLRFVDEAAASAIFTITEPPDHRYHPGGYRFNRSPPQDASGLPFRCFSGFETPRYWSNARAVTLSAPKRKLQNYRAQCHTHTYFSMSRIQICVVRAPFPMVRPDLDRTIF